MENLEKLKRDIKASAATLGEQEARYLVDLYYQMQDFRIQASNQARVLTETDEKESHETISFLAENYRKMENNIKSCLETYAKSKPIGQWLLSICGIGPVIAAGLMAHIDIKKCETAGAIWKFAGLDPTSEWKKGEKRPWNAKLRTLSWKIGQSFMKVSGNDKDFYGHLYKERKALEQSNNEEGLYAEQAKAKLEKFKIGKTTEAYKWYSKGMLPPGHIDARARRYAVKIFLSHLFDTWYRMDRGCEPPKPFAIAILNHAHEIKPPM